MAFITTDAASNAKRQVKLSAAEEGVILDIIEDLHMSENSEEDLSTVQSLSDNEDDISCLTLDASEGFQESAQIDSEINSEIFENLTYNYDFDAVDSFLEKCEKNDEKFLPGPNSTHLSTLLSNSSTDPQYGTTSSSTIMTISANWNHIVCSAHRLQLSVRLLLDLPLSLIHI